MCRDSYNRWKRPRWVTNLKSERIQIVHRDNRLRWFATGGSQGGYPVRHRYPRWLTSAIIAPVRGCLYIRGTGVAHWRCPDRIQKSACRVESIIPARGAACQRFSNLTLLAPPHPGAEPNISASDSRTLILQQGPELHARTL